MTKISPNISAITVDEKDPPWMNESIKKNIMAKKSFNANKNLLMLIKRTTMLT